jgi:hypothetical protein
VNITRPKFAIQDDNRFRKRNKGVEFTIVRTKGVPLIVADGGTGSSDHDEQASSIIDEQVDSSSSDDSSSDDSSSDQRGVPEPATEPEEHEQASIIDEQVDSSSSDDSSSSSDNSSFDEDSSSDKDSSSDDIDQRGVPAEPATEPKEEVPAPATEPEEEAPAPASKPEEPPAPEEKPPSPEPEEPPARIPEPTLSSFLCGSSAASKQDDHFLSIENLVSESNSFYCQPDNYLSSRNCQLCGIRFVSSLSLNTPDEGEVRPSVKTPVWVCMHDRTKPGTCAFATCNNCFQLQVATLGKTAGSTRRTKGKARARHGE